jgi:tRNA(Arg) A34 adenosine deaminase TadA
MHGTLDNEDRQYLRQAVELSKGYEQNQSRWPFGAILVMDGKVVGQGVNQVVELHDPAAHAEIMALRDAGAATGQHIFQDSVLYSSCEPCPMCLAAAYWARLEAVYYGACAADAARAGFDDAFLYEEMRKDPAVRKLPSTQLLGDEAWASFAAWLASPQRIDY